MVKSDGKKIDYLTEDSPIQGQSFVCVSFLSPEGIKNCSVRGVKVRGVYPSYELATNRAKELQEIDPDFDVFVGEVGKWLPWDPDPNSVEDQQYREEKLQEIANGYSQNLRKAKKLQEERKRDAITKAADAELSKKDKTLKRLRKKVADKQAQKQMDVLAKKQVEGALPIDEKMDSDVLDLRSSSTKTGGKKKKEFDDQADLGKQEKDRIVDIQKEISTEQSNVENYTDKLERLQSLYDKLKDKKGHE
jgi:hypothetical protein